MTPQDAELYVKYLEKNGLRFLAGGKAIDLAIVDQQNGLTIDCGWLEFGKLRVSESGNVSACWLFDGQRFVDGLHTQGTSMRLATPAGWKFEGSLSDRFGFVPTGQEGRRLKFLRNENNIDVYLDLDTGKEVYVGRTN